ncbi:MAG: septal ring lytic transglycosylase RlpA family protein [Pseudomonadota bacterium]
MAETAGRHDGSRHRAACCVLLPALLLAGCQSAPPATTGRPAAPEPFRNVYTQDKDSAPVTPRAIDYHAIPDAVPQAEPRGRYGNKSPYTVLGKTYEVLPEARGYREEGTASWYGEKFQGFRTSSMEPYDMYAMTAAHKTLPIPSYVRVTNLANDRSVVVRVNDRGPFHDGRIIDLSWAAAQKLGYAGHGTARVRVEALLPADAPAAEPGMTAAENTPGWRGFCVQVGAYAQPAAAESRAAAARLLVDGEDIDVAISRTADIHRVRVGPWAERTAAERMRDRLRAAGLADAVVLALP